MAEVCKQLYDGVQRTPIMRVEEACCWIADDYPRKWLRLVNLCEQAKADGLPCRFPQKAIPSLEAHGIHVSKLAEACGMRYINGQNTVTYFGAVLFGAPDDAEGAE